MTRRRLLLVLALLAALGSVRDVRALGSAESLPARLTDQEFWSIVSDFSEPNGYFLSDNLLSNEVYFQYVIPDLAQVAEPGRVYLGVGPEQNFTYIAAIKPKMAFIVDIRRGNRDLQLMYKALFELAANRAEFVSLLFSRKRPTGLGPASSAAEIFAVYSDVPPSEALYTQNLKAVRDELVTRHKLPLSAEELAGIEYVYHAFYTFGPTLKYSSTGGIGGPNMPTYADLMTATDGNGRPHSYLASEEAFAFVKALESKNLLVPLVGDFAGPKAIRAVGQYLTARRALVSAFYLSNVEQFLYQNGIWGRFCSNVATLPLDESSTFIRAVRGGRYGRGFSFSPDLGAMAGEVKRCNR